MANRMFTAMRGLIEIGVVELVGAISIASDGSVSACTIKGATAAKTATGTYTITLADPYAKLLHAGLTLSAATAVDLVPQVVSETVATTKLVVFKTLTGSTATTPSAVCTVYVSLKLKNSSVK